MYKPLQKKNSSWTPTTAQKKSKSPSKLGHFSIQPKSNKKSSQPQEIGEYSRDSADRLAANVMRSLEAKDSQDAETPTVQPQSESRISVADVVGQRMPNLTPHTLSPLQRKLTVGQPGDKYEQEADTVAAKVVEQINSPTSQQSVQGKVEPVVEPTVMRDGGVGGGAVDDSVEQSIQQAKGGGQGLSENVKEPMEQAFGADFSGVKIHTDGNANQLNRSLNARAFTTGPDIFFKQGEYNPGSRDGQELLAHELTHVVQQTTASKPIARMKTEVIQRVAVAAPAVVFGPVGLTIVGFGIVVWYLNNGGWEEIGRISNVIARGIDGTLEDLENILNRAGDTAREGLREIEDYIREHIFPMAARGNQADTGILAEANELISSGRAGDICEALAILMAAAKAAGDTNKINRIKATQKAKRCRHSRHSRDS